MTTPRTLIGLILTFSTALVSAQTAEREPLNVPQFEVEVACEEGTAHVGLADVNTGSYIELGSVNKRGGRAESTTKLVRPLTRSWVGKQLLSSDESAHSFEVGNNLHRDIERCTGRPGPQAATTGCIDGAGWCFCIPDEEDGSDCNAFHAFCAAIGGESNHNSCTF